ncbi:MAG: hypothetical protein AB8B54_02765 [Sphingorhabdus sp.]
MAMANKSYQKDLQPTESEKENGRVFTGEVAISQFMFAEIVDDSGAFEVSSQSEKVVDMMIDPTPKWEWNLKANKLGKHDITVRMGIRLTANEGGRDRYFPLQRKTIKVSPTLLQRVELFFTDLTKLFSSPQEAIEELAALFGLLGALGAAYWAMRKKWRRPESA